MTNPYSALNFIEFLATFFTRLALFLTGSLSTNDIVSDEVQILVLILVCCSCAMVGTFLILRKMVMLANSLSHTILLGIIITHLLFAHNGSSHYPPIYALVIASIIMGLLTTALTEFLSHSFKLQPDASNGIVFTTLFALGILITSLFAKHSHLGIEAIMGNVDALHKDDITFTASIFGLNTLLFFIFYKPYKLTTFDPIFASSVGLSVPFYNYLLMTQTSLTSIGAFRAVGVLMVLALITIPPLTARLFCDKLLNLLLFSMGIGSFCSIIGVALSRHFLSTYNLALSTSGIIVCLLAITFFTFALFNPRRGIIIQILNRKHLKKKLIDA